MKKFFAKENEKFVKKVHLFIKEEGNTKYVVDENNEKVDPDFLYDLFLKGLIVITTQTNKHEIVPFGCFRVNHVSAGNFTSIEYAQINAQGDLTPLEAYSDGYTAG